MNLSGKGTLLDKINGYIADGTFELPVFNAVSLKVMKLVNNEDFEIRDLERLICQDQVLASKVLSAANSSFFGGLREVRTVRDAIIRLSAREVANLAVLVSEKGKYSSSNKELDKHLKQLWRHAVGSAIGAQWLAKKLNYGEIASEAFIAGLVHDIGKLFLIKVLDHMQHDEQLETKFNLYNISKEIIATLHPEKGFEVLQSWNIPMVYCTIVRDHHIEQFDPKDPLMLIVRLANQACNKLGLGPKQEPNMLLPTLPEAQILRAKDILLAEFEILLEDSMQLA